MKRSKEESDNMDEQEKRLRSLMNWLVEDLTTMGEFDITEQTKSASGRTLKNPWSIRYMRCDNMLFVTITVDHNTEDRLIVEVNELEWYPPPGLENFHLRVMENNERMSFKVEKEEDTDELGWVLRMIIRNSRKCRSAEKKMVLPKFCN